jgi:hypothetical protein
MLCSRNTITQYLIEVSVMTSEVRRHTNEVESLS